MRKLAYVGLVLMLTFSVTACGEATTSEETVVENVTEDTKQNEQLVAEAEPEGLMLTSKDFEPFFKTVFSLSEEQLDLLNRKIKVEGAGYFENLGDYQKIMTDVFKPYFSKEVLDKLQTQNIKLSIDLPKKSQINDYVVEGSGTLQKVEVQSSRQLGEEILYEVAVTTTNKVIPYNDFAETYVWNQAIGYYEKGTADVTQGLLPLSKHNEAPSYTLANGEHEADQIKLISSYWVSVIPDEGEHGFKVSGLQQGGSLMVDDEDRQKLDNTSYMERIPYYETVSKEENAVIKQLFKTLMNQPQETYKYYEKIYNHNFDLTQTFFKDLNLEEVLTLDAKSIESAFAPEINPYKNDIVKLSYDESKLQIKPSLYSSKLQPAFVVTLPLQGLKENNETAYYYYKYYVGMEAGKVEVLQLMKISEVTAEDYLGNEETSEETSEEQPA